MEYKLMPIFIAFILLLYFLNNSIFLSGAQSTNSNTNYIVINSGIRDLASCGETGIVRLANDFLVVEHLDIPSFRVSIFNLKNYKGERLFTLDFNEWRLNGESLLEIYHKPENRIFYFYDWRYSRWRVWMEKEYNETHGIPDFNFPAFKHIFMWKYSFRRREFSTINVTFYMSSWDPFVRIFIDKNGTKRLQISIKPKNVERAGIIANYSNYEKHLLNWNQKDSKLRGNPWAAPAWSDCAQGFVGQSYIVEPTGVEFHKITNYYQNLNRYIQGHAYNFFNWRHDSSANWYSYEFYLNNNNGKAVNVTVENFTPDSIEKVEAFFFNGSKYVQIGLWSKENYGKTVVFTDQLKIKHLFTVYKPVFRGEPEASGEYGVIGRFKFTINLSANTPDFPEEYGGDQVRLKIKVYYSDPGYATYVFSNTSHPRYGLLNMLKPYILLFNYKVDDEPVFIIVNDVNISDEPVFVKSDENEEIKSIGFNMDSSNFLLALGYNGRIDTTRDEDRNSVPDFFEKKAFEWSTEKLEDVAKEAMTYCEIFSWVTQTEGEILENRVTLKWHYSENYRDSFSMGEVKLFGLGVPSVLNYEIMINRIVDGREHLIVWAEDTLKFSISYFARKYVKTVEEKDIGYFALSVSINFTTSTGKPYTANTVVYLRGLIRKIYGYNDIPEGPRNLPDIKYWRFELLRNGIEDWNNWVKNFDEDVFYRIDKFSSVKYFFKIEIKPKVEVYIDYNKKSGTSILKLAIDLGYRWDDVFDKPLAIEKAKEINIKIVRIHLRTIYRDSKWAPHTPCIEWDPEKHMAVQYDWNMLDYWIKGVVEKWNAIPLISIGGSKVYTIPKNMPYLVLSGDFILPEPEDFAQYFADVTKHIVVDLDVSPVFLEVINEPYINNDTTALLYMKLYNKVRQKVAGTLAPYGKKVGKDVFLGINYIDRGYYWPGKLNKSFFEYVLEYAAGLEFGSVHNYPGGWNHCFSPSFKNSEFLYFPPNDKKGWLTDSSVIKRTYDTTLIHGSDPRITFKEMQRKWREKFGSELMLLNTEANLNSEWRNGSDPRQQDVFGAIIHAIMLKNYAINNFSYYTFFTLASMHGPTSPMFKYGGYGFAIINSTYPHEPFAPYLVARLWSSHFPSGSNIYEYSISNKDLIDILPVKANDTYNIWIICKVDSLVDVEMTFKDLEIKEAKLLVLDQESYNQYYDPEKQRIFITKRGIKVREINAEKRTTINFTLKGYSVAVLEIKPLAEEEHLGKGKEMKYVFPLLIVLPLILFLLFYMLRRKNLHDKQLHLYL